MIARLTMVSYLFVKKKQVVSLSLRGGAGEITIPSSSFPVQKGYGSSISSCGESVSIRGICCAPPS
jgi:hypothetical protein